IVFQVLPFLILPEHASVAQALSDLASLGFALFFVPLAAFVAAVSWAGMRFKLLPIWAHRSGMAVAVLSAVASVGANLPHPSPLAAGGPFCGLGLGAFIVWFWAIDLHWLRLGSRQ
ncbi:MAG: hypothetical protein AAB425_07095, partial [Bdellovibrionota bacterium]